MEKYKYLIIGGGVAGTTAAETLRQNEADSSIAIISDEPFPLYSKVMMSKPEYFTGKIPEDKIFLKQPDWYKEKNISYLLGKKAAALDTAGKIVTLDTGEKIEYEKLLLATGNTPRKWDIPGSDKAGIFSLRRLNDYKKIKEHIGSVKNAVAVGSGFISFEMCEIMRRLGINITLVMRENYYWEPVLDKDSGKIAEEAMEKAGVKIIRNAEVKEILGDGKVSAVVLKSGEKIDCDMIMVSIGNFCDLEFVKNAGIEVTRGIVADEYLKTNAPDVWTAGDVADFSDIILEEQIELGTWVNAKMQGQTAAMNMMGKTQPFRLVSSCNAHGFDTTITFVGDTRLEKGKKLIIRRSADSRTVAQLFERFGELVGATFINGADELPVITALIEKDVKITGHEEQLRDPSFDLKTLLNK